ncbi:mitogen-activated protein kinase kinase kinase 20-like [Silene latifolia]|uniref:mitogen-activated protein kinase kinase kinase 20-like n=1 Tax=Silene latifolia TaxID=37657 RepID=UPI003D788D20
MEFMDWVKGPLVGRGSFGTVNLVIPSSFSTEFSPTMVVKSSAVSQSECLKAEKQALSNIGNCKEIVRFFGDGFCNEKDNKVYNLFFEYAEKGSLEDNLRNSGGKFKDCEVRRYTKGILKGLGHIHGNGYVHCDIKLSNILLFDNGAVKIADFGLATKIEDKKRNQLKGTPLFMSPELVAGGEVRSSADIWALGCAVVQMVSGKSVWEVSPECDVGALMCRIGLGIESPRVPEDVGCQAKDFISKCFIKDPNMRWTARMLLDHPFVNGFDDGDDDCEVSVSPRDPFEFADMEFAESSSLDMFEFPDWEQADALSLDPFSGDSRFVSTRDGWSSACERLGEMASDSIPDWSDSDGWIDVR